MEGHCLSALLQRPRILSQVNAALEKNQLEPLTNQDFQTPGLRAIFEAWEALLTTGHPSPTEALHTQVPADLQGKIEDLLNPPEAQIADDQLARDVVLTVLRLRERNLRRLGQELNMLTLEAQEAGDMRAEQYAEAWRSYADILLNTQRALAQRWGWLNQG
jgi:hypothetical protein